MYFGKVEITAGFVMLAAAIYCLDSAGIVPLFAGAVFVHELGHYFALKLAGGNVRSLRLGAAGAEISADFGKAGYCGETLVYFAGPVASAALAIGCALAARWNLELLTLGGISLLLGLFNLLPARQFDGGNIARTLCLWAFGRELVILKILHYATCSALLGFGIWNMANGEFNLSLLVVSVWLLLGERQGL